MKRACRHNRCAPPPPLAREGVTAAKIPPEQRALARRDTSTSPASGRGKWKSRRRHALRPTSAIVAFIAASLGLSLHTKAEEPVPYKIVGDGIPASLTGSPGDAARGRTLVLARTTTCILCHSGPFPETRFQGDLAPDLAGAGNRWTASQLRLRLVDASRFNAETIMPSYYRSDGLVRVGRNFVGKPILSATEIEDIVAFLATLRD